MGRHRNMPQMEEQEISPGKELNIMEANKLPDTKFKTRIRKMLRECTENFRKDIESTKRT